MNIKINLQYPCSVGSGIFSKFFILLPTLLAFDVEKVYFFANDGSGQMTSNPFDWVFEQSYDDSFVEMGGSFEQIFTRNDMIFGCYLGAIEDYSGFEKMKQICSRIVFKEIILNRVKYLSKDIDGDTLGVHTRLTDMNRVHGQYGIKTTQHYIDKINKINPKSLYLATDNNETVTKIKSAVSYKVLVDDTLRRETTEDIRFADVHMNLLYDEDYWQEVFSDMLTLSLCNSLVCGVSNFSNAAILFSKTFKNIYRI